MVGAVPVILYAVISFAITIWMTVFYARNYRRIRIGYPIAVLAVFTALVTLNAFPVEVILGQHASEIWISINNGGYYSHGAYDFFTILGLTLLTLRLYCTANVVVGLFYVLLECIFRKADAKESEADRKSRAVDYRKELCSRNSSIPEVNQDFSFTTDRMPENGIIVYEDRKIEIINNSGKRMPEGIKRIYARHIGDYRQHDSRNGSVQSDELIPYIEIWAFEPINED